MTSQEAIKKLWLLRNKYECLTYKEAEKISITNAEFVDAIQIAIEALKIADRLEQADADVYNKCCEVCTSLTICKERCEMCDEANAWEDGYNQALADIRGGTE